MESYIKTLIWLAAMAAILVYHLPAASLRLLILIAPAFSKR